MIDWLVGVGTFAVISLMVGTAVSEANCDVPSSSDSDLTNTTTISSVANLSTSTVMAEMSSGRGISPEMQCRVGVAVAVTFLAGIYQVIPLLRLNLAELT